MQGKNLLVLGEGGSHFLYLNGDLWLALAEQLCKHKLKYCFDEGSRGWSFFDNYYMSHPDEVDSLASIRSKFLLSHERQLYNRCAFTFVGIDFERREGLYMALNMIMKRVQVKNKAKLYKLAPYLQDTSYLHIATARAFQQFYRKIGKDFMRDSSTFKSLLESEYSTYKYIVTNPNTATPWSERNRPMAKNLLAEITPVDTNATYLLDCGMAHSRPNVHGTLVNILSKSPQLKNRILVMNVACMGCKTDVEAVSNWAFPFLNNKAIANAFTESAKADIVVYDLSSLPKEYDYIKAYGDLLVLAKGLRN